MLSFGKRMQATSSSSLTGNTSVQRLQVSNSLIDCKSVSFPHQGRNKGRHASVLKPDQQKSASSCKAHSSVTTGFLDLLTSGRLSTTYKILLMMRVPLTASLDSVMADPWLSHTFSKKPY